jgi:ribokinase
MARQSHPSVVVLGGINMDLVTMTLRFPEAGETVVGTRFLTYPGGKGANQAVAAARMGAAVAMVGRVGDDVFGPQLLKSLTDSNVDISAVDVAKDTSSGLAIIDIDASSQNRIIQILGANDTCGPAQAERVIELLPQAAVLMLQLEVDPEVSLQVARRAHEGGKKVILDPGPVRPVVPEFYTYCSVITPNETEAQALVGFPVSDQESAARAAGELLSRGAEAVVVKLGAEGAFYATQNTMGYVPPFSVQALDSVAAGDAFNGALAVCITQGQELDQAVITASAAGALSVTHSGAQNSMPFAQEVAKLVETRGG